MRILLVATNRESAPFPVAPLGALCIAAAARAAGHDVRLLDMGTESSPVRALRRTLGSFDPKLVGFSIRNLDNCFMCAPHSYFDEVRILAETVRENFRGPLVLGGSGFSVSPCGWLRRLDADCGVIGEGELAFIEMLARIEAGKPFDDIPGVITRERRDDLTLARPADAIKQLETLAMPAHEMCRYSSYLRRGGTVSVQTKRGCPFGCAYCIYPKLEGRRYRLRAPAAVVDEIASAIKSSGAKHFFFSDSVFNDPREHAIAVCEELRRRSLPMRWMAFVNPFGFDDEVARAMAASGCEGLEFGLDAATPVTLSAMKKPFNQQHIKTALQAAKDAGIPFAIHMLYGGPGDTWEQVEESQKFLASCAEASAVFASFGIRIYEGTPMETIAKKEGAIPEDCDLFNPVYYVSPAMAENTAEKIDRIARQRPEWTSPIDWNKPVLRLTQKIVNFLGVRPQWRDIRNYGLHMRK